MCRRRRYLVASVLLLLEALFNHCMGLTASNQHHQAPSAPSLVSNDLSPASTSRACADCAPKTSPSLSSTSSSSPTLADADVDYEESAPSHSEAMMVHHYERQLLNRLGLSRRPSSPAPEAVAAISDHMHSLYRRFDEDDEWEDFLWIAGDRRRELGRLTSVRAHRISDAPRFPNASLRFDLSSMVTSPEERPVAGELRLFLNLTGPHARDVAVYEVMPRRSGGPPNALLLHRRRVRSPFAAWASFDVSPAVLRWSRRPRWRPEGHGQLLMKISAPRRVRRSAGTSPGASSPGEAKWTEAELFSYYQNTNKRERRRHRRRKRNRKRSRKRSRGRRRRRRWRQRQGRWRQTARSDDEGPYVWPDESAASRHEKRNAMESPDHSQACQLRSMYVDFGDVGWNEWIVAPPGYHAGLCHGLCTEFPLSDPYNTTNHAIIQYLVSSRQPHEVPPPCCVAIHLRPKAMLMFDENQNVVLKNYEEMIVDRCGCR